MESSIARDNYLVTEVNTATPQKLQLLLVEGALRLANRARQSWQDGRDERALAALLQAQEFVAQILGGIDHEAGGEVAQRVSAHYEFIYRSLVSAGFRRDVRGLGDAIRILEIERETWRQLCDKLAADSARPSEVPPGRHRPLAGGVLPTGTMSCDDEPGLFSQGGFSVEA